MEQELKTLLDERTEYTMWFQGEERHNYRCKNFEQRRKKQCWTLLIGVIGVLGAGFFASMCFSVLVVHRAPIKTVAGDGIINLVAPFRDPVVLVGPPPKAFNCQVDYPELEQNWSEQKKNWCCENMLVGCPINCQAGLVNWEIGWSKLKKSWCCQRFSLGCSTKPNGPSVATAANVQSVIAAPISAILIPPNFTIPITTTALLPTTSTTPTTPLSTMPTTPTTVPPSTTPRRQTIGSPPATRTTLIILSLHTAPTTPTNLPSTVSTTVTTLIPNTKMTTLSPITSTAAQIRSTTTTTLLPTTNMTTLPPITTTTTSPTTSTTTQGCHTAVKGEICYESVTWAYYTGILTHPDWYPGLNKQSSFEDFQAKMAELKLKDCLKPCNTHTKLLARKKKWGHPSLFCFSVARGFNPEMDLMKTQIKKNVGIFACDEQAVLSDHVEDIGMGVKTIHIDIVNQGGYSEDGTAANTQAFVNAWHAVSANGRLKSHDFTVKADPDTVLLPDRLRSHLNPHIGANVYVANCNMHPDSSEYPMMYGALEVLSKTAMEVYIGSGQRCQNELPWQAWGEDRFMGHCMQHLGVSQVLDTGIIQDANCGGADCHNGWAAAFHHFKDPDSWLGCYRTATR